VWGRSSTRSWWVWWSTSWCPYFIRRTCSGCVGVVGNGIATGLYIGAGLGPGARDGLTTGIASRGYSIRVVRTTIEAAVLLTGFLLGGTVGIGTVFYALGIGPITHKTIPALAIDERLRISRAAGRRGRDAPGRSKALD
jgi:uncharacterized membrane protein YczE